MQLGIDDLFVTDRINRTIHVYDVLIVETTKHMNDSIRLADIGEELVTESFSFAGALNQSCYIYDLHSRRNHAALRMTDLAEFDESLVRHRNDTYVRLYRTEREIGALRLGIT